MELHLSSEVAVKLSALAAQQGRPSEALAIEAIERMVDYDTWFLAEVEKGQRQIESGQTLSHEEVGVRIEKYLAVKQPRL